MRLIHLINFVRIVILHLYEFFFFWDIRLVEITDLHSQFLIIFLSK